MADKWLTCPVEKSERTFGEILGKAVFQTDATGLEKTK
jgi:hypothetical protein